MSKVIRFRQRGNFRNTEDFLKRVSRYNPETLLKRYGQQGVEALRMATPKNTGETANSWYYTISNQNGRITLSWSNSNVNKGVQIAVILQYGHATKNGGWVEGIDYINPAIRPIFDRIAAKAWEEVMHG